MVVAFLGGYAFLVLLVALLANALYHDTAMWGRKSMRNAQKIRRLGAEKRSLNLQVKVIRRIAKGKISDDTLRALLAKDGK